MMTACPCGSAQRCAQCSGCPNCCSCGPTQSEDEVRGRRGGRRVIRRPRPRVIPVYAAGMPYDANAVRVDAPPSYVDGPPLSTIGFTPTSIENPGGGRIRDRTPPARDQVVVVTGVGGKRVPLHRLAASAWQALVTAARRDGIAAPLLLPVSGFRDPALQERLWRNALQRYGSPEEARKWVAPPGGSAHQTGRAIDFYLGGSNDSRNVAQLRTLPAYRWLISNATRFGFYPYEREPWHWEYNPPATRAVESEVIEGAALGVAVFQVVQSIATSGDFSTQADVAKYVHQNTPANVQFTRCSVEFKISAHHPRIGFDRQNFYFRLSFEYNRYDLRNVSITPLRDKSSTMLASTFSIQFRATEHSLPSESVTRINYNIQGRWDPVGLGDVSFDGNLLVHSDGRSERGTFSSERDWVTFDGFLSGTRSDTPIPLPPNVQPQPGPTPGPRPTPPPAPGGPPTIRSGSRGPAVTDLQVRMNRWLVSQGRQPLVVDNIFGSRTRAAVIDFQRANSLVPDGIVGPRTWGVLRSNW